jgi:hypothetical protein
MMINRPASLGSVLAAVLLVLMPAQQLLASVAILSVAEGEREPIARSVIKETVIGERFEAKDREILEVLLSDGTSLTLGPGSAMVIESFAYDPQTQSGQLSVRLERGQFRVVGGLLNNRRNIVIQTPTGKLDLDSASVFVEVDANGATRASLLHGKSLKLTTNGQTETVERPAFEVVSTATNQPPKGPSKQTPETAVADAMALNSELLNIGPDLQFAATALDETESGSVEDPGTRTTLVLASLNALGTETPVINSPPASGGGGGFTRPQPIDTALNPSGGFGPGGAIGAPNISVDQPSQSNDDRRSLPQTRENAVLVDEENRVISEPTRDKGRTTNRLFNSTNPFTQVLVGNQKPVPVGDSNTKVDPPDTNLQYVFSNENVLSLVIDSVDDLGSGDHVLENAGNYNATAPFYLTGIELPQQNQIFKGNNSSIVADFQRGEGSIFEDGTHFKILQAGFSSDPVELVDVDTLQKFTVKVVRRKADNFLLVEVRPAKVDKRFRDDLKAGFVIKGGAVEKPEAFIEALGLVPDSLDETQINLLAAVILNPNLKPGTPLTDADLKALSFLSDDDRLTIRNSVNVGLIFSPPDSTARYVFATGDIDNRSLTFPKEFSVDRFFISAGLENFEQKDQGKTVADGIRAFLRKETGLGLNLVDTGLLVVNAGSETAQNALLHADFGLQGTGSGQQSTISVTIGNVVYQITPCGNCEFKQSVEAVVEGRTIGSSHGAIEQVNQDGTKVVVNGATVGFSSPIRSTAAGGGNPALKNADGTIREGYAGYFVLENFDPEPQAGEAPLMGGTEKPLGGSGNDQAYAYLRLATATGSSQPTLRNESTLNGWMGGLAEFQNGSNIGLTQIDSGDIPDNVKIQTSPTNNTVEANFTLRGQDSSQFTSFNLGGLSVNGTSAFVDDNRFAARSINNGYEVAMVTADLFRDANGNLPASLNMPPPLDQPNGTSIPIPQYEHLKWGFFFGDTKTTLGQREHVHLGTWIAGKIPTGDSLGLRGTASYSGHSIGNVFNNGSLYTAVGSFQNDWNFDTRKGTANMNFDKMNYTGTTAIKDNTFNFTGNLNGAGRSGGLQGSFVAPVNPTPTAVMGRFAIAETPGNATYRAAGTFGAERK